MILGIFRSDISIYDDPELFKEHLSLASDDRKQKIERLKPEKSKKLSLLCTHMIDEALKEYGLFEKDMLYAFNDHGKPFFKERPDIAFNLSHSGDEALLCMTVPSEHFKEGSETDVNISKSRLVLKDIPEGDITEIGCDIEKVRGQKKDRQKIAERFFHEKEKKYLASIKNPSERDLAFTQIWTFKESFIKADGTGLGRSLDSFSVLPHDGSVMFDDDKMTVSEHSCHFEILDAPGGYRASVCILKRKKG